MNRETLLTLYDRFTGLVEKLPGGLQKPILRELVPIRELFLEQRPARLLLLGPAGRSVPEFLARSAGLQVETGDADHGWRLYHVPGRGSVQILDGRADVPDAVVQAACAHLKPDAAVLLWEAEAAAPAAGEAARRLAGVGPEVPVIGVAFGGDPARARLAALFAAEREFALRKSSVCSPEAGDAVAEVLCAALPNNARLEFARLTVAKKAQAEIAGSLLKSFTAVCGVIGLQPIPLADMPVLTSLQTLMVSLVIYTTGKPANPRLFAEFVGALGINIGAGLLFREGARALIRIVPFWGNAVSGMIAGAGTYAIGRAAIAYFIEERPVHETKQLFHRLLPSWDAFKAKRGSRLPKASATPPPLPPPGAGEE